MTVRVLDQTTTVEIHNDSNDLVQVTTHRHDKTVSLTVRTEEGKAAQLWLREEDVAALVAELERRKL